MGVFLSISRDIFKNTLLAPIREVHSKIWSLHLEEKYLLTSETLQFLES